MFKLLLMFDGAKLDKKIEITKFFWKNLIVLYKFFWFLYKKGVTHIDYTFSSLFIYTTS